MKLLPFQSMFCVQHTTMHEFTVTVSLHAEPHTQGVCLAVTCHMHLCLWHNDLDLSHVTAVTQGWNGYSKVKWESAEEADPGEENSSTTPARARTQDFKHTLQTSRNLALVPWVGVHSAGGGFISTWPRPGPTQSTQRCLGVDCVVG